MKLKKLVSRGLTLCLTLLMAVGMFSMTAFAY